MEKRDHRIGITLTVQCVYVYLILYTVHVVNIVGWCYVHLSWFSVKKTTKHQGQIILNMRENVRFVSKTFPHHKLYVFFCFIFHSFVGVSAVRFVFSKPKKKKTKRANNIFPFLYDIWIWTVRLYPKPSSYYKIILNKRKYKTFVNIHTRKIDGRCMAFP